MAYQFQFATALRRDASILRFTHYNDSTDSNSDDSLETRVRTRVLFSDEVAGHSLTTTVTFHTWDPPAFINRRGSCTSLRDPCPRSSSDTCLAGRFSDATTQAPDVSFSINPPRDDDTAMVSLARVQYDKYSKRINGAVTVQNIAYEKEVFVRYTTDGWRTWRDEPARYLYSRKTSPRVVLYNPTTDTDTYTPSSPVDLFSFSFALDDTTFEGRGNGTSLELTVAYTVAGHTYWDNNLGANYRATFTRPVSAPPSEITKALPAAKAPTGRPAPLYRAPSVLSVKPTAIPRASSKELLDDIAAAFMAEVSTDDSDDNTDILEMLAGYRIGSACGVEESSRTPPPPLVKQKKVFFGHTELDFARPKPTRSLSERGTKSFPIFSC